MTLKLQVGPAVLVQVTNVVPSWKNDPEGGSQVTVPQSAPDGVAYVTFAPHWSGSLGTSMAAGQERLQVGSVSAKVLTALAPLLSGLKTPTRHGPRMSVVLQAAGIAAFDAGNVKRKGDGSAVIGTGV